MVRRQNRFRFWIQLAWTALTNGYAAGFLWGKIYTGSGKKFCLPGLNCYSCPGALGACPVGSLQALLAGREFGVPLYLLGFLILVGTLLGRLVCGFLCPFGLVQDLLYRIPFLRKWKRLPGHRWLRFLKYGVLVGFVIVLPLTVLDLVGQGQPWFCKYICPSGTLFAGIPLIAANPGLQAALGWLFTWKAALLAGLLLLSVLVFRPFCQYLCPLGAVYGLFHPVSLYRYTVDASACITCGACQKACPVDLPVWKQPNSPECIRCGACRRACPKEAIRPVRWHCARHQEKREKRTPE